MADPISLQILRKIQLRLQAIRVADGFNTDAGSDVYLGIRSVNPDQLDYGEVISVYELRDQPSGEATLRSKETISLDIGIEAVARYGPDVPADKLAYLWQDIMRAVFIPGESTIGGIALSVVRGTREYNYPSDGGELVAVRQTVSVQYTEPYGEP